MDQGRWRVPSKWKHKGHDIQVCQDRIRRGLTYTDGGTYSIPTLIEHVSSIMKLEVGDVILTGTPSGVGPIHAGQVVTAGLRPGNQENDLVQLKFDVVDRTGGFVFKK